MTGVQGLDGQWKGLSFASGEAACFEAVVSSSEDSSLAEACVDSGKDGDAAVAGTSYRKFLSGDQPGGRRLVKN